jgi:hypothetical protein
VSIDPQLDTSANSSLSSNSPERRWLPIAVAAAVVVIVAIVFFVVLERGKSTAKVTPISATPDAYAANLPISKLVMSESANLAGSKVMYVDGVITNGGDKTVTGITVQVLFRSFANEVAQNDTQSLKFIRTREPYVDVEPVSAAPLKPGDAHEFRLIFDGVTPNWNGNYPDVKVISVETR